jgi:hypothetical protein
MTYQLHEVKTARDEKDFTMLPVTLYQNDPHWVRPLDKDINKLFDPAQNKILQKGGACVRWLLKDTQGNTIGRVAAFVNPATVHQGNEQPTGGMGFFECINNQTAANILFDACREWLRARGMEAMDGPINFGERDSWWGLLVDGFTPPNYGMHYHFPYYQTLFEQYGFQEYFKQFTYLRIVHDELHPIVVAKADRILNNPDYHFCYVDKKKLDKFAEDFRTIYNKAWTKHEGVAEMSSEQALKLMNTIKPIMDERIIFFGYHKGEPIAFYVHIPDLNQALRYMNTGSFNALGVLRFLWFKWFKGFDKMVGLVFGVIPEQQGRGVEAAIVRYAGTIVQVPGGKYKTMEMNWIGDFNPKMMKVAEIVGGRIYKTHITYRYLFDRNKEFKRAAIIK